MHSFIYYMLFVEDILFGFFFQTYNIKAIFWSYKKALDWVTWPEPLYGNIQNLDVVLLRTTLFGSMFKESLNQFSYYISMWQTKTICSKCRLSFTADVTTGEMAIWFMHAFSSIPIYPKIHISVDEIAFRWTLEYLKRIRIF